MSWGACLMHRKNLRISLKIRIFLFFFMMLSFMILFFIGSFYRFISKFTFDKMDKEYASIANELNDTSQELLWNLTLTSQQLLENEDVRNLLTAYKNSSDIYQKQHLYEQLTEQVSLLTMSETDVSLLYFYDSQKEAVIYSNLPVNRTSSETDSLYQYSMFQYCGPSKSQSDLIGSPVFILNRTAALSDGTPIRFSVESGYYSLSKPMDHVKEKSAYAIFTNENGKMLYHSFPGNNLSPKEIKQILSGNNAEFHTFSQQSSQGWSVYIAVPNSVYTLQYKQSLQEFVLFSFILSVTTVILSFLFWRSIYHPLQAFDQQLNLLLTDEPLEESPSSIPEFDFLFQKIRLLQKQIKKMLERAVRQEKENTKIQLEKLRAQINPHFLLNTLNTIHWMALMNQQKEIDEITQALSHLLSYNLDRDSYNTNLLHELNAVKEYVNLQKTRYRFSYKETILPEGALLNYPCPKFILQPFIENSLSHGYKEDMCISVSIHIREQEVEIKIADTGSGMPEETLKNIQKLIDTVSEQTMGNPCSPISSTNHSGRGIGLAYVIRILHLYYNGQASVTADSRAGSGTEFHICLPKLKGSGYNVENIDHR